MYDYQKQRKNIFTPDGQIMFLKIRDEKDRLLKISGAVIAEKLLCVSGETWDMMACVDRLIELGEIKQIRQDNGVWQHKVFVSTY